MLRKLTVSYGPTEMLYIGASPGGLPAGEVSPSRHADCGTGTTGARRILRKLTVSYRPTEMLYIGPIIGASLSIYYRFKDIVG